MEPMGTQYKRIRLLMGTSEHLSIRGSGLARGLNLWCMRVPGFSIIVAVRASLCVRLGHVAKPANLKLCKKRNRLETKDALNPKPSTKDPG